VHNSPATKEMNKGQLFSSMTPLIIPKGQPPQEGA
jgi:hypothetical protein